ncbi:MAG TPA: DUF4386 domain-containing protein [Candidatus Dormibacteraeota bacterium]|nr:DUF4386 domain-containing protein [Candidatus Dormibacteraeota bacterium]
MKTQQRSLDQAGTAQLAYARFAGLMYLIVDGLDIGSVLIINRVRGGGDFLATAHNIAASETLYRFGICCGLLGWLSTILLAIGLYVTVKPVNDNLALTALLFRLAESTIGGVGAVFSFATLQTYLQASRTTAFDPNQLAALADISSRLSTVPTGVATVVANIFFAVGSAIFFYLFLKRPYIPRVLAAGGLIASLFWLVMCFIGLIVTQSSDQVFGVGALPIGLAEIVTGLWLLIRGIKIPPVHLARPH